MKITCRVQENMIHGFRSKDDGTQVFTICKQVLGHIIKKITGLEVKRGDVFEIDVKVEFIRWIIKAK